MPTTIADGETYPEALQRRYAEEVKAEERMNNDRELLELAAKAAGFPTMTDYGYECLERLVANIRLEYEAPLKLAEEALQHGPSVMTKEALAAIREALADPFADSGKPIAEQEPMAWWNGKETAWFEHELDGHTAPDGCTIPLYAAPQPDMNLNCKSVQKRLATSWGYVKAEQAEREPVAWRVRGYNQFKTGNPAQWRYVDGADKPAVNKPDCCDFEPLYAAPVRTKDLTDKEIWDLWESNKNETAIEFYEAIIAAYKEKNK